MAKQNISISTDTIVRTILILMFVGFLFLIKDVLALFFVAMFRARSSASVVFPTEGRAARMIRSDF